MAQILLHGTLHVTIFEVDKLRTNFGREIFNKVKILILILIFHTSILYPWKYICVDRIQILYIYIYIRGMQPY